ncbi:MAG: glycosyltransferase [Dehalococcoidia bacterium]
MIAEQEVIERVPTPLVAVVELSVVIPAYNEAERIGDTIRVTAQELSRLDCCYEIVVVDDGSKDLTHRLASEAASSLADLERGTVRIVSYEQNCGKGRAVKFGTAQTRGKVVAFLDADMELHPKLLRPMLELRDRTGADIVIGSKRHPESVVNYPVERKIYSTLYYYLVNLLFGLPVRDTQTGIKVVPGAFARGVLPGLHVNRFAYDLEMLVVAHRLGLAIAEAPIELNFGRRFRRIGTAAIKGICLDTLSIWWRSHFTPLPEYPVSD